MQYFIFIRYLPFSTRSTLFPDHIFFLFARFISNSAYTQILWKHVKEAGRKVKSISFACSSEQEEKDGQPNHSSILFLAQRQEGDGLPEAHLGHQPRRHAGSGPCDESKGIEGIMEEGHTKKQKQGKKKAARKMKGTELSAGFSS